MPQGAGGTAAAAAAAAAAAGAAFGQCVKRPPQPDDVSGSDAAQPAGYPTVDCNLSAGAVKDPFSV